MPLSGKQVAIAIDQLINTLMCGMADETISARLWRNRNRSWWWAFWRRAVDHVFFMQDGHCYQSYLSEVVRGQLPKEYSAQEL